MVLLQDEKFLIRLLLIVKRLLQTNYLQKFLKNIQQFLKHLILLKGH